MRWIGWSVAERWQQACLVACTRNTTADCQHCSTTNSTGSMSLSEWSTSWLSWCAGVWRIKLQGTWSSAALRSLTSTFSQPALSDCSVVLMKHRQPLGLLCSGSIGLELTACRTAWANCQLRRLSSHVDNYFVRAVLVYLMQSISIALAIEMLCMRLRYINLILTLTLTLCRVFRVSDLSHGAEVFVHVWRGWVGSSSERKASCCSWRQRHSVLYCR